MFIEKNKKVTAFILAMALVLGVFVMPATSGYAAGLDVTHLLQKKEVEVTDKDGNPIPAGDYIPYGEKIFLDISFRVPVIGDAPNAGVDAGDPDTYVTHMDLASFEISEGFSIVGPDSFELMADIGKKLGDLTLGKDGNKVVADVVFNGDADIFQEDEGWYEVYGEFTAELEFDGFQQGEEEEEYTITILDKTFKVKVPAAEKVYEVEKEGILNGDEIEWRVTFSGRQLTTPPRTLDLGGLVFSDDLSSVGDYVDGSLTVNGNAATPSSTENSILKYEFPDGTDSPALVTFKTKIKDSIYNGTKKETIANTAELQTSDGDVLASDSDSVEFNPIWIEKTGTVSDGFAGSTYNPTNRTITWTIVANQMGRSITGASIKDTLPSDLMFDSAEWFVWNGSSYVSQGAITPAQSGNVYTFSLGDINSQVKLVIVTKVPDETYSVAAKEYTNKAELLGGGISGTPGDTATQGIGFNAISKSGSRPDLSKPVVKWSVTVDVKGQNVPSMRVFDLLVHGNTAIAGTVSGLPAGISLSDLTQQLNQKYVANSFSGTGLAVTVHPITLDGEKVADLLEVTGFTNSSSHTFTFESQILNPDIFASNTSKNVRNTASLFSGTNKLVSSTGTVSYVNNLLSKEMLERGKNPLTEPNARTNDASKGFDYADKSVIFRLSINADGIDLPNFENVSGTTMGAVTVTDVLPEGWEFVEIVPGSNYLLFEGVKASGKIVHANGPAIIPPTTVVTSSSFDNDADGGAKAEFTFSTLNKPYLILVKAKPTVETQEILFGKNETTTVTNTVKLKAENSNEVSTTRDVSVKSQILYKGMDDSKADTDGYLIWTIDYNPANLDKPGAFIEDVLSEGIELPMTASGDLDIPGNISLVALEYLSDGSLVPAGSPIDLPGTGETKIIEYNNDTRVLRFNIAGSGLDTRTAYRLQYVTYITGNYPEEVSNVVELMGVSESSISTEANYAISRASASASMKRGGWIEITKIDGSSGRDVKLAGAQFRLLAEDGTTVLRTGTTDSEGKVMFKGLPVNTEGKYYILEETNFGSMGFEPLAIVYRVTVSSAEDGIVTEINGEGQEITLYNYKTLEVGNVEISKVLSGSAADAEKDFDFTINAPKAMGPFEYDLLDSEGGLIATGTAVFTDTGFSFSLKGGQRIVIKGVPFDTYTVEEADYSGDDYMTFVDGELADSATLIINANSPSDEVEFKNSRAGWIEIYKFDASNGEELLSGAEFTLFDSDGNQVAKGTTDADGVVRFYDIDPGEYILKETKAPSGYENQWEINNAGDIEYSVLVMINPETGRIETFFEDEPTNTIYLYNYEDDTVGDLTVSKTLSGNATDKNKEFVFRITFGDETAGNDQVYVDGLYPYIKALADGSTETGFVSIVGGVVRFGDDDYFGLKGGESLTIKYLPKGAAYMVTEEDYSGEGYRTSSTGEEGTIEADETAEAKFVNSKSRKQDIREGSLSVSKTVTGNGGDKEKRFSFVVTFSNTRGSFEVSGTGEAGKTIKSGDTFTLAHGESITITGIPEGTTYKVQEVDYSDEGYTTTATGHSGEISDNKISSAKFTNDRKTDDGDEPDDDDGILDDDDSKKPGKPGEDGGLLGDDDANVPKTGDDFPMAIWFGIFLLSVTGIAVFRRRPQSDE